MEISSHQFHLLQQLNEQRKQDLFCDCSILVEGKVFKAHRNVLFASSGYFKMLLSQGSKESGQPTTATFQAFSPDTFSVILDFVYSGKLSLTGQNVIEVMSAASYLQMTDVISVCKTFIKSSLDISEKEKDRYFSLSDKEGSANGVERLPDPGACLASGNSWASFSYYSAPPRSAQPLAKHDQRPEALKKSGRPLVLPQPADIPHYKDRTPDPTSRASPPEEDVQIDSEGDSGPAGYQYGQGSDPVSRGLPVPQPGHESPHSMGKSKSSKVDETYSGMPSVLGVMGSWADAPQLEVESLHFHLELKFPVAAGVGNLPFAHA
ncbi:hypothetical protein lerEdw1_007255 [Lerista edwardsae]|nr:hypothetical protein lerEdw1_007255 [Lerista edwardsae]